MRLRRFILITSTHYSFSNSLNGPVMILPELGARLHIKDRTGEGVTRVKNLTRTRVRISVTREIVECVNFWH